MHVDIERDSENPFRSVERARTQVQDICLPMTGQIS